jgi:hypothetical protein
MARLARVFQLVIWTLERHHDTRGLGLGDIHWPLGANRQDLGGKMARLVAAAL